MAAGDDGAAGRAGWIKTNQGVAVCIAGVVVSGPNFSARCGRTKLS